MINWNDFRSHCFARVTCIDDASYLYGKRGKVDEVKRWVENKEWRRSVKEDYTVEIFDRSDEFEAIQVENESSEAERAALNQIISKFKDGSATMAQCKRAIGHILERF